jgi:hypothetical protein
MSSLSRPKFDRSMVSYVESCEEQFIVVDAGSRVMIVDKVRVACKELCKAGRNGA